MKKKMEKLTELILKFCPPFLLACWFDVRTLFSMVFILLLIDNIAAIYEAYKFRTRGRMWFHYKKMFTTIEKFIAYGVALVVGWMVTQIIGMDFGLDKFIAGYIAIYESISIFGHLSRVTGLTLFSDVIDWLKNKVDFKKYFQNPNKKDRKENKNE